MKHIKVYFGMIVGLLAMLTSCSDSIVDEKPSNTETDKGMKVEFNIAIPSYEENTTRSITFGTNEGIDNQNKMLLFCFDNQGQFVGFGDIKEFEAVKGGSKNEIREDGSVGEIGSDGSSPEKKIKASLPSNTSRIHFVANANEQYKTIDMKNQQDWVGMHENILMTTFETQYGEDQAQKVRYWGYVKKDNPQALQDYLNKTSEDHIVHLLRDRAKISAEWADKSKTDKIEITVINGMAYGTLAPFNRNELEFPTTTGDDKWKWNIDYITPSISTKRLKGDVGQMYNPTYTFENRNLPTDPMKVILKINGGKKYLVYLQDYKNIPYVIKRNYEYKIRIEKLDESLGYDNLEEALKSAPINNPWIKVDEIVPEIGDEQYKLGIVDGPYKMINAGNEGESRQVQFTYTGDESMTEKDFYVTWIKNEQYAEENQPVVKSFTYDSSTGKGTGTIEYKIKNVDKTMREGTIHIIDTKHGLNKNVHLYSVSEIDYNFKVTNAPGNKANDEGLLEFTVPTNYPEAFLPIEIKVASNDINLANCSVEVGDTKQETGNNWNCWFVDKIQTTGKHTITLKNLRDITSGSKGCFWLKADNFNQGKAKKFTFTYK